MIDTLKDYSKTHFLCEVVNSKFNYLDLCIIETKIIINNAITKIKYTNLNKKLNFYSSILYIRNRLFSSAFCGAWTDFGLNGWKPRIKNVRTKLARSLRSLRIHKTTELQPNFSSANSSNVIKDCLDASGNKTDGNATYKMLFVGLRT